MNTEKGMSQILVLIVAAAVLMMVGLLLITLSSNSITGVFQDTENAACSAQLESMYQTQGTAINADEYPNQCLNDAGEIAEGAPPPPYEG